MPHEKKPVLNSILCNPIGITFIGRTDAEAANTVVTSCEEPTHGKRPWCWERLRVRGEAGNRGGDGWTASPTHWTWVWVNFRRQWRTRKPMQTMGSQRVRHDLVTEQHSWSEKMVEMNNSFMDVGDEGGGRLGELGVSTKQQPEGALCWC